MTPKNWTLNSYTNDTWTDLLNEPAVVSTLIFANTTVGDLGVSIRLEDGGSGLAVLLSPFTIAAGESKVLDMRSLNVTGTQALQVQATGAGIEFTASGAV